MRVRRSFVLLCAIAAITGNVPITTAQSADAPHLSPDNPTLWAHGTGSDQFNGFMNPLQQDGNDDALGSGGLTNAAATWTLTLNPALAAAVVLDTTKMITFNVYMGASQGVGRVSVTTKLTHGTEVIAQGPAKDHTITPADANTPALYGLVTWSVAPTIARLEPGSDLVWSVTATGTSSAIFIGVGSGRGRTNAVLPVLSVEEVAAGTVGDIQKDFNEPSFNDVVTFDNATTGRVTYNWTHNASAVEGDLEVNATGGSLSLIGLDGDGSEAFSAEASNDTANESGPQRFPLEAQAAASGSWNITIMLTNFTGSYRLLLGPASAENMTGPPANETGNTTEPDEDGGVPGFETTAFVVSGAIATAFWARGRRRNQG